ncbi:MAG TPA: hypothetical protein VFZ24_07135 [Longimicrobiales bacterium]
MSSPLTSTRGLSAANLSIDGSNHPGWVNGTSRAVQVGEEVLCTAGLASVVRVHGKTGDGSRLLELQLREGKHPPFFARASNVLLAPTS